MITKRDFKKLVKSSNEILERLDKELYMMMEDDNKWDSNRAERIQEEMNLTIENLYKHYKDYYNRENSFLIMMNRTYK